MDALRDHALEVYPHECCGWIDEHGVYHRMRNTSPCPEEAAIPSAAELGAVLASGRLRAFCHSHPGGPNCPSQQDMETQIEMEVPFIIIATDGQASLPPFAWGDQLEINDQLIGRPFRHGVTDCYSLIRDWWYHERGVLLPDFPRGWEWWNDTVAEAYALERDLYRNHFADAGFKEIDRSDLAEGDVWLAAVRSSVPNHAGIYLGGGLALHHASSKLAFDEGRLSKREPIARWLPYVTHCLRRE